ncbi:MAG: hypothetical protein PVH61_09520 [Candidatus Aminicenantes bacterium]
MTQEKFLRSVLKKKVLKPVGPEGFEGLTAKLLEKLTGNKFYIAKAGYQAGKDMSTSGVSGNYIAVECKLYSQNTRAKQGDLLSKLEVAYQDNPNLDLWVVVITRPLDSQLAHRLYQSGWNKGIEILDIESNDGEPDSVETLCAYGDDIVVEFFKRYSKINSQSLEKLKKFLIQIKEKPGYNSKLSSLKEKLSQHHLGFNSWHKEQNKWLFSQFGAEANSRSSFRQSINIHGKGHTFIERKSALESLDNWLNRWGETNNIFVLTGEEGDGKTWAAASWVSVYIKQINKIPVVFLPARNVATPDIEKILSEAISARQKTPRDVNFWEKRIDNWMNRPHSFEPIMILVFDGINENLSFDWQWLLEKAQVEPWGKRIAMALTSRTKYWQDRFSQSTHLKEIHNWSLPPYNDVELNEALARYKLTISDLPGELHHLIRKPRYLDLVVKYRDKMVQSEDITVQRLIYEDFKDRVSRIRKHYLTNDVMESIINGMAEKARLGDRIFMLKDFAELIPFVDEKLAIFEELRTGGIFFHDDLRKDKFKVEPKRLAHGLGIILLDHLRNLSTLNQEAIEEGIALFLEPQPEMDFKVEIVAAAVFHVMNNRRLPETIRYGLLKYWIRSVNLQGNHLDDFPSYFPCSPQTYFKLAENILKMDMYDDMARRLLQYTFIKWAKEEKFLELFKKKFEKWMGYVNIYGFLPSIEDEVKKIAQKKMDEIQKRLGCELSVGSVLFLDYPLFLTDNPSQMNLSNLALHVISYLDRRPFVRAITIFVLAKTIMGDPWEKSLLWILRINKDDIWPDMEKEVSNLIKKNNIEANEAASYLLWYEGSSKAITLRKTIPENPLENDYFKEEYEKDPCKSFFQWKKEHYSKCLQRNDIDLFTMTNQMKAFALEPDLHIPETFKQRLPLIAKEIKPALIWSHGMRGEEEYKFEQSEVALYAFSPETASKIIKSIVRDAINRDRSTIGRLPFKINENYLIFGNKEITAIKNVWQTLRDDKNVKKSNDHIERYLFRIVISDFSALEQLKLLIPRNDNEIWWSFYTLFKKLDSSAWDEILEILEKISDTEIWRILWFISKYPKDILEEIIEKVKELFTHSEKYTRGFALKIAYLSENLDLITTFINSTWSYSNENDNKENYWGSLIIAKFGNMLPYKEVRDRIMPSHLAWAVSQRGMKKNDIEELSQDLKIVLKEGSRNQLVKDIVKMKPDLVKVWINPILPSSPEIDYRIERDGIFYSTLCGILLDVNPDEGVRLYRRLKQVRGHQGFIEENTRIDILMYDVFRAKDCEEITALWDEIVDDCYKDIDILEIAIVSQEVNKSGWLCCKIDRYLESDLLFNQARGINMLGFLDLKNANDKLTALLRETPECWLRPVIETAIKRWNNNQWARTWFQRFLEYEDVVKAWAAFKLFLKCADRRFWIWVDDLMEKFGSTPFFEKRKIFFELNRETTRKSLEKNEEKLKKEFLGSEIKDDIWPWRLVI